MEAHEVLIGEYEALEREFDQFRAARMRECERLRLENKELRRQLKLVIAEVAELQNLLERAWIKP